MNLFQFLHQSASRFPDKTAVACDDSRVTYSELLQGAEKTAARLAALGIARGTRVGLLSANSIALVEALFALMKLGAVGVPFNWRLTGQEIARLAEHAETGMIIAESGLGDKVPHRAATGMGVLSFEELQRSAQKKKSSPADFEPRITEQDISFILYTAGTTGTPKGVVLTHGNHIWNTLNYTAACSMTPQDRELAPTPLFHSSTLGRLFTYVFNGMTVYLCRSFSADGCLDCIERENITAITQAPTMFTMMIDAQGRRPRNTATVRRAVTGAAPMSPAEKQALSGLFPRAGFYDIYGLTEAAPGVTILQPGQFFTKASSIGKPMLTVQVEICDEDGKGCAAGSIGEIVCRGPNIMRGYYRNEPETARSLRNGALFTGDMGLMDKQGYLYLTGRKKDIIISGGTNIYPGEVEQVLLKHPAVYEAAALGVPDRLWGEMVTAAVVRRHGTAVSAKELTDFCRRSLAGFKCPRKIVFMEALPRNAAGKVVRQEILGLCSAEPERPGS